MGKKTIGCGFCNAQKPKIEMRIDPPNHQNFSLANSFDAIIEGEKLTFKYDAYSTDSSFEEAIKIKFCPKCGTELKTIPLNNQ